jgi:hypothetical protein
MRPIATVAALVVLIATLTGCNTAMSAQSSSSASVSIKPAINTVARTINGNLLSLRFRRHNFEANCYNTQRCFVIYNGSGFLRNYKDAPSPAPSAGDYRGRWGLASHIGFPNSATPAKVTWTSLDGSNLEAFVDISTVFKDELVLHSVRDDDLPDVMFKQGLVVSPSVYLEINDRTISVFFQSLDPNEVRAGARE